MIKVPNWTRRAKLPVSAAMRLVYVALLLPLSFAWASAHKEPVDYLPRVGPAPLRFEMNPSNLKSFVLPPLDMGSRTKENPANAALALSQTNRMLPSLIKSPGTNQLAKIKTNAPALPLIFPATNALPPGIPSLDAAAQLAASPLPANESVFTPQMLVHFFQKTGTNGSGMSVTLPVDATRADSTGKSSSATYVSP